MNTDLVMAAAVVSLLMALGLYRKNASIKVEDARMREISGYIQEGAMAYLKRWQSTTGTAAGNVISFNDRAYDLLIYVVAETGSNSAREACLHDAEALLLDDCGVVPLYYYGRASQLAEDLTGLYSMTDGTRFFRNVTVKPAEASAQS